MTIKKPLVIEQPKLGQIIHKLRTVTGLTQELYKVQCEAHGCREAN